MFTNHLVPFEPAMELRSRESRQLANVVTALPPLVPLPPLAASGIVNVKIWKGCTSLVPGRRSDWLSRTGNEHSN